MIEIRERFCMQRPHPSLEPVQKRIEQDEILVDGIRVGYCGTQRGAPLTLLFDVAEATLHQIKYELDKRDGVHNPSRKVAVAPKMRNEPDEPSDE